VTVTVAPLVTPAWLEAALGETGEGAGSASGRKPLVVVDLRDDGLYAAGHITGSINIPFSPMSDWAVSDDELLMEVPPAADLFASLGRRGITPESPVVLVGAMEPPPAPRYTLADAARAAATLHYVGVDDVAVLDGGFPRWKAEGRPVDTEIPTVAPVSWEGPVAGDLFVATAYVKDHLGRAVLIDGRDPDQFFGVTACPFAGVGGHIPSARPLPAPWIWREDGTYHPLETLRAMAEGVVGPDRRQEIIVYCGVGGYASALWFVLARVLGYSDVKIYDASAEGWVKSGSMVSFEW
jgi:thiosulfate/3-mercaptopyruvate sulfurtransferase